MYISHMIPTTDWSVEPHRDISGMQAAIGPEGDTQVMPASGSLFVGYLHALQPQSTQAS
jgi:hypothetical protein